MKMYRVWLRLRIRLDGDKSYFQLLPTPSVWVQVSLKQALLKLLFVKIIIIISVKWMLQFGALHSLV